MNLKKLLNKNTFKAPFRGFFYFIEHFIDQDFKTSKIEKYDDFRQAFTIQILNIVPEHKIENEKQI